MLKVGDKARFIGEPRCWKFGDVVVNETVTGWECNIRASAIADPSKSGLFFPNELALIQSSIIPTIPEERKKIPVASGVMDYFPAALVEVAKVSYAGNEQHNPGEPLHWARNKSTDQDDTIIRHFLERGTFDTDGLRHTAKLAWRVLALLQLELEAEGAPIARGAK